MTTNRVRRLPLAWHDKNHCLYSKNNELELAASFASRLNRKGRNSASRAETISWVLGLKPIYCSPKLWYGYYGHQDAPSKLLLFVSLNRRTPEVQPSHPCSLLVAALSLHWQIPHSSRAPEQPKKGKPIHGIHMNSCIVQGKTDEKRIKTDELFVVDRRRTIGLEGLETQKVYGSISPGQHMLQSAYAPENHSLITLPCVHSCFIMCCICNAEVSHIQIECRKTKAESTMRPSSNLLLSLLRVYLRFHLLMLLLRLMLLLLSCTSNLEGLISPNTQQMGPI